MIDVEVEANRPPGLGIDDFLARHAGVELRTQTFCGEEFPQERWDDDRRRSREQGPTSTGEHAIDLRNRLAIGNQLIHGFQDGDALGHGIEISEDRGIGVDGFDLIDDVEFPAFVQLNLDARQGFQTTTEFRPGLTNTFGNGTNLAVFSRQENDDPVGFSELVRSKNDPFVPVQL